MPIVELLPHLRLHFLEFNPHRTKTVLLLHGLGVNGSSWQLQFQPLEAAGFHILAPDIRGFGQSSYPPGKLSVPRMAEDMACLLQMLGTGPVSVAGISMGGTVAQQMALDHPELVEKLVLINTFPNLKPAGLSSLMHFAVRYILVMTVGIPRQAQVVATRLFPQPDQEQLRQAMVAQVLQANPRGYRASMLALARFNVIYRLAEIKVPTLVVSGGDDTTIPLHNQNLLVKGIPGARQVIIPEAGHGVIADHPNEFNQALVDFLIQ